MKKTTTIAFFILFIPAILFSAPLNLSLTAEAFNFDNADMVKYDRNVFAENQQFEDSNTDDRSVFALSTLRLNYSQRYLNTDLHIGMRGEGFWGNDNLGENNQNSALFFDELYTNIYIYPSSFFRIGRFTYSIGNSQSEFFFEDIIDGAMLYFPFEIFDIPFAFSLMCDVTGLTAKPAETERFEHIRKDDETIKDYNGDTVSYRGGALLDAWFFKGFGYYLRYAASDEGGADISQNGATSQNKSDGDYLYIYGGRVAYDFSAYGAFDLTFAWSTGYDFQFVKDHAYSGYGLAFNYVVNIISMFNLHQNYIEAVNIGLSAAEFTKDYCGMYSPGIDDTILYDYAAYSVSPYAGAYHFQDYNKVEGQATKADKTVSKSLYRVKLEIESYAGIFLSYSYLQLYANDNTATREEMGVEHSFELGYSFNNILLQAKYEHYIPGAYYSSRSETNSYIPQGKDPFYCISFACTTNFNMMD